MSRSLGITCYWRVSNAELSVRVSLNSFICLIVNYCYLVFHPVFFMIDVIISKFLPSSEVSRQKTKLESGNAYRRNMRSEWEQKWTQNVTNMLSTICDAEERNPQQMLGKNRKLCGRKGFIIRFFEWKMNTIAQNMLISTLAFMGKADAKKTDDSTRRLLLETKQQSYRIKINQKSRMKYGVRYILPSS